MINNFTSPYNRPYFLQLKLKREESIISLINSLKIGDVKDDEKFAQTTQKIKNSVLLKKVVVGEPKNVDYKYEQRPLNMNQQLIGGISIHHYIHEIEFPFFGDSEFFDHIPEIGFSYSSSDHGLILPYHNKIKVYVDLPELNPTRAIAVAENFLSMNIQFVNANNASVDSWAVSVIHRIEHLLLEKREELVKLFDS